MLLGRLGNVDDVRDVIAVVETLDDAPGEPVATGENRRSGRPRPPRADLEFFVRRDRIAGDAAEDFGQAVLVRPQEVHDEPFGAGGDAAGVVGFGDADEPPARLDTASGVKADQTTAVLAAVERGDDDHRKVERLAVARERIVVHLDAFSAAARGRMRTIGPDVCVAGSAVRPCSTSSITIEPTSSAEIQSGSRGVRIARAYRSVDDELEHVDLRIVDFQTQGAREHQLRRGGDRYQGRVPDRVIRRAATDADVPAAGGLRAQHGHEHVREHVVRAQHLVHHGVPDERRGIEQTAFPPAAERGHERVEPAELTRDPVAQGLCARERTDFAAQGRQRGGARAALDVAAQALQAFLAARRHDHAVPGAEQRAHDRLAHATGATRDQDLLHVAYSIVYNDARMSDSNAASVLFSPLSLREVTLRNRVAVSPMCEYSSSDGFSNDWHLVHLGSRAVGGAGLVLTEAIAVTADGRISPDDLGIWQDAHVEGLARIARFCRQQGAAWGTQLAHAGRKASTKAPWDGSGAVALAEGGWIPGRAREPTPSIHPIRCRPRWTRPESPRSWRPSGRRQPARWPPAEA